MFLSHFQTAISSPTMCPFSDWFSHLSHAVPWTNPAKLHHISIEELNPGAQHRACERPGFPHHPIPILNSPWLYGSIWVRHMCGIPCSNQGFLRFEPQIWYQLVAVAGGKNKKPRLFWKRQWFHGLPPWINCRLLKIIQNPSCEPIPTIFIYPLVI